MSLENEAMIIYGLIGMLSVVTVIQGYRIKKLEKRFEKDLE